MSFFSALSDWSLGRSRTSFWVGADMGFSSLISGRFNLCSSTTYCFRYQFKSASDFSCCYKFRMRGFEGCSMGFLGVYFKTGYYCHSHLLTTGLSIFSTSSTITISSKNFIFNSETSISYIDTSFSLTTFTISLSNSTNLFTFFSLYTSSSCSIALLK